MLCAVIVDLARAHEAGDHEACVEINFTLIARSNAEKRPIFCPWRLFTRGKARVPWRPTVPFDAHIDRFPFEIFHAVDDDDRLHQIGRPPGEPLRAPVRAAGRGVTALAAGAVRPRVIRDSREGQSCRP